MGKDWPEQMMAVSGVFLERLLECSPFCLGTETKSPIESMMGTALWAWCQQEGFTDFECRLLSGLSVEALGSDEWWPEGKWGTIGRQVKVGPYTADFLVLHRSGLVGLSGGRGGVRRTRLP